jgi:hypothetical protein
MRKSFPHNELNTGLIRMRAPAAFHGQVNRVLAEPLRLAAGAGGR